MKTLKTFLLIVCLGTFPIIHAQTNPKPQTPVTNNFLDLQAGELGDIFGDSLTGGKGNVTNYLELVDKSDRPEAEKKQLREAYFLYSKALDAKGKDSLQTVLTKKLLITKKDTIK
tara:strand:- start:4384 stop:4728 length:345 start_codon:yes stop_codon:yes gene_type:complete